MRRCEAVIDPLEACKPSSPILHAEAKTNEISVRKFHYGDTKSAFEKADKVVKLTVNFHRLSFTPMECFVAVASHNPADDSYDCMANFQGPFSTHPVMARALRVPGPKMRLRIPPDSGGSFGIKLSVFPYVVLTALAAKITGRPVKWVEDRAEHLLAASSGPNRVTEIEAAVTKDGKILGLKMDQLEDYGAFLRAPMPGPLYRMHGAVTGGYDIANCRCDQPRGADQQDAGEPHPRLRRAAALSGAGAAGAADRGRARARTSRRDPAQSRSGGAFPYKAAAGGAVRFRRLSARGGDRDRRRPARISEEAPRRSAQGRHGNTASALPSWSSPPCRTWAISRRCSRPETRDKAGPKNGATSMVTVNVDPLGAVSVTADVTVQGQGHETVLSQIVADQLGLRPEDVDVTLEMDTAKDQWSIAAGTYSCRFTPGTAVAAHMAAAQMAEKLKGIAAKQLNVMADDVELSGGKIRSKSNPDNALPFGRVAGTSHWSPVMLPEGMAPALSETGVWNPPELEPPSSDDRINTSLTYGFVFDMCGIEIDPVTYQVQGRPLRVDARRRQQSSIR